LSPIPSASHHRITAPSYATLGLLPSLNPRAKGGEEIVPDVTLLPRSTHSITNKRSGSPSTAVAGVPKGHGRIIRDEHGNVVDIQLDEEDRDEEMKVSQEDKEDETPWGVPMEDWGNEGKAMPKIEGKTEVIKCTPSLPITRVCP
jgi:Ribosome biogenesis protein Nop16